MNLTREAQRCLSWRRLGWAISTLLPASLVISAAAQGAAFQLDPSQTSIKFTVGDVLHTVQGTFQLKHGSVELDPASGTISGEIVVDAKSGESGSAMRDRKMHNKILESERYPEISFRQDRIEGGVAPQGESSIRARGMFNIQGVDREITVPAEMERSAGRRTATAHFTVPHAK
jgi:polyisoprenoid-binding protein YceI